MNARMHTIADQTITIDVRLLRYDALYDVIRWINLIFRSPRRKYSRYFVWQHRSIISMFWWTSGGKISQHFLLNFTVKYLDFFFVGRPTVYNLDVLPVVHVRFIDTFSGASKPIVFIFCRDFSKRIYSVIISGVSLWIISMLYRPSHVKFSRNIFSASRRTTRYFVGRVRRIFWAFFRTPRIELHCKFVGHFTVTFLMLYHALQVMWLDILSGASRSLNSIFCRACRGVIHRQFVWRLWVNFLYIFGCLTSIIQVNCRAYCSE